MGAKIIQRRRAALRSMDIELGSQNHDLKAVGESLKALDELAPQLSEALSDSSGLALTKQGRSVIRVLRKRIDNFALEPAKVGLLRQEVQRLSEVGLSSSPDVQVMVANLLFHCDVAESEVNSVFEALDDLDRLMYQYLTGGINGALLSNAWAFESLAARDEVSRTWGGGNFGKKKSRKLARAFARHAIRMTSNPIPLNRLAFRVDDETRAVREAGAEGSSHPNFSFVTMHYDHLLGLIGPKTPLEVSPYYFGKDETGIERLVFYAPVLKNGAIETRIKVLSKPPVSVVRLLNEFDSGARSLFDLQQSGFASLVSDPAFRRLVNSGLIVIGDLLRLARQDRPEKALSELLGTLDRDDFVCQCISYLDEWNVIKGDLEDPTRDPKPFLERLSRKRPDQPSIVVGASGAAYCDYVVPADPAQKSVELGEACEENLLELTKYGSLCPDSEFMRDRFRDWLLSRPGSCNARVVLEDISKQGILSFEANQDAGRAGVMERQASLFRLEAESRDTLAIEFADPVHSVQSASGTHHMSAPQPGTVEILWDHAYGPLGLAGSRFEKGARKTEAGGDRAGGGLNYVHLYGGPHCTNIQRNGAWGGTTLYAPGDAVGAKDRELATLDIENLSIKVIDGRPRLIGMDGEILEPVYTGYLGRKYLPTVTRALLLCNNVAEVSWTRFFEQAAAYSHRTPSILWSVPRVQLGNVIVSPRAWTVNGEVVASCVNESETITQLAKIIETSDMPLHVRYVLHSSSSAKLNSWDSQNELPMLKKGSLIHYFNLASQMQKIRRVKKENCNVTLFETLISKEGYSEDCVVEAGLN